MKSKKGVVSVQFNWLFILIAGAVILLFFFSIVQWQKKSSDSRIDKAVLTNLDTIFTGAETVEFSSNVFSIPKTEVGFDCNNYYLGSYNEEIKRKIMFSPNLIQGTRIVTHTLGWKAPYKITNLFYLTSPQIRYIFVYDDTNPNSMDLLTYINKSLPPKFMQVNGKEELAMNREYSEIDDLSSIYDENNYKVKFIFFETDVRNSALVNLGDLPDEDITAIRITEPKEIKFYQKEGFNFIDKGTSYYLRKEAIIGAIFAEDSEMYNCSIQKAFKQYGITSKIYSNRSYDLMDYYLSLTPRNTRCGEQDHKLAAVRLNTISIRADSIARGFNMNNEIDELLTDISEIQRHNNDAQLHSCVLIY